MAVPNPFDNTHLLDVLKDAVRFTASGDLPAARHALSPIAGDIWNVVIPPCQAPRIERPSTEDPPPVGPFGARLSFDAMREDRFRCRYCANLIVPLRVLEVLSRFFPDELPYNIRFTQGKMHPIFWTVAAEADHLIPKSRGGSNELSNLRTACVMCNTRKGNCLIEEMQGWSIEEVSVDSGWDGLTRYYDAICDRATFDLTRRQQTFRRFLATTDDRKGIPTVPPRTWDDADLRA